MPRAQSEAVPVADLVVEVSSLIVMIQRLNLNANISKILIFAACVAGIIILCVGYNYLSQTSLTSFRASAECNNGVCFSVSGLLPIKVRSVTTNEIEDDVINMCRFPDPKNDKYSKFYAVLSAMRVMIPRTFDSKFKNPCWYSNFRISRVKEKVQDKFYDESISLNSLLQFKKQNESKILHCLPYFFIAGFPRSGTTALYNLISHHPQFAEPLHKEVHWFTHTQFDPTFPNNLKSVLKYINHFNRVAEKIKQNPNFVTCDASASTLWNGFFHLPQQMLPFECEVPLLLSNILPNAKYVVMLRNPLERLYSDFWYRSRYQKNKSNAPQIFHHSIEKVLNLFITCQSRHSPLQCLYLSAVQEKKEKVKYIKLQASLYYLHMLKWFSVIPRQQFFFIKSEELLYNYHEILKDLFEFLNLPPIADKTVLDNVLKSNVNSNEKNHEEYHDKDMRMLNETKLLLRNFFRPFNRKLANLLNDKRFLWDDV